MNKYLDKALFEAIEEDRQDVIRMFARSDPNVEFYLEGQHNMNHEFLKALAAAHQCMPVKKTENNMTTFTYQGPSPDEIALVEFAQ